MIFADSDMGIFNKISTQKIPQLFDLLDESIFNNDVTHSRIIKIIEDDVDDNDIKKLLFLFRYVVARAIHSNEIINGIDDIPLDDTKKILLKHEIQKLYDRIDLDKIKLNLRSKQLKIFGHPHIHEFMFTTEFRPISKSDKIIKLVPSIIAAGTIHNNLESDENINFQLDLKQADKLMHDLQMIINSLNDEIQNMRDKFGDDIID